MITRKWTIGLLASAVSMTLSACGAAAHPAATVLATVNGQPITNQAWQIAIDSLGVLNGQKLPTDAADKKAQVEQLMVWSAVQQWSLAHHLITQQAAARGAEKLMNQLASQAGGRSALDAQLKNYGLTPAQFESFLTQQQILESAFNKVTADIKPPSALTVKQYYEQNQSLFAQPQSDEVRAILVKTKQQALKLEAELKAGANFAALAKKYSLDSASAQNGGQLGTIPVSASAGLPSSILDLLTGLGAGQYGIASTTSGYYLLQVEKITPPSVEPLASVQSSIAAQLEANAKNQAFQAWGTKIERAMKPHLDLS
jgi:parvulin-like peptidyl-prolyl isomerase